MKCLKEKINFTNLKKALILVSLFLSSGCNSLDELSYGKLIFTDSSGTLLDFKDGGYLKPYDRILIIETSYDQKQGFLAFETVCKEEGGLRVFPKKGAYDLSHFYKISKLTPEIESITGKTFFCSLKILLDVKNHPKGKALTLSFKYKT